MHVRREGVEVAEGHDAEARCERAEAAARKHQWFLSAVGIGLDRADVQRGHAFGHVRPEVARSAARRGRGAQRQPELTRPGLHGGDQVALVQPRQAARLGEIVARFAHGADDVAQLLQAEIDGISRREVPRSSPVLNRSTR